MRQRVAEQAAYERVPIGGVASLLASEFAERRTGAAGPDAFEAVCRNNRRPISPHYRADARPQNPAKEAGDEPE